MKPDAWMWEKFVRGAMPPLHEGYWLKVCATQPPTTGDEVRNVTPLYTQAQRDDHPTEGPFMSREEQDRWVDRTPRGQFYLRQQARMHLAAMIVEEILSGDESGLGGDYETDLHHKLAQVMELIPDDALAASKGAPDSEHPRPRETAAESLSVPGSVRGEQP